MNTFLFYKAFRKCFLTIHNIWSKWVSQLIFWGNNISYSKFKTHGIPLVSVAIGGSCSIGKDFSMNNGSKGNPIGCFEPCTFFVDKSAKLIIGDHVGISQTAIICHCSITIGNHVKIGGGVCIYDTDFHALDPNLRTNPSTDFANKQVSPVNIQNNVFIGAHSLVLKGVTIGENSIVGAGSVVTKSIPANEIWAGNPAKFIRSLQ